MVAEIQKANTKWLMQMEKKKVMIFNAEWNLQAVT